MQIAQQIAEALEDGHRQGLPHLNLRPSNVMLSTDGVKLVNYGISRLTSLHPDGKRSYKKYMDDYLAPEQLSRRGGDERSDIYAIGTILYEMLIGHPPSVGRFYYPSEVNIEATSAVDILIDHAREDDPNRRFATAEAMRTEMDRITIGSLKRGPNQILRFVLAWVSERYEKLTSRTGLAFLLSGLVILLTLSILFSIPVEIRLPARMIPPGAWAALPDTVANADLAPSNTKYPESQAAAAADVFFKKDPRRLTAYDAALLATVLPNPKRMRVNAPSRYVRTRQRWILSQMRGLGGLAVLQRSAA